MSATDFNNILDRCLKKTDSLLAFMKDEYPRFPHTVRKGKWYTSGDDEWNRLVNGYWTGGFWVGMLYIAHHLTGNEEYQRWARRWMAHLKPRSEFGGLHDLGFLFFHSAVLAYELGEDDEQAETALKAAYNVSGCYSGLYKCLYIMERPPMDRILAVDTMMNLPILWWAASRDGNEVFRRIAVNHAATTMEFAMRDNGASFHIIKFEEGERKVAEIASWQGRAPDSCWARGQAWAISGLAYSYLFTGDKQYLRSMDRALDFFTAHLPESGVPFWDLLVEKSDGSDMPLQDASALAAVAFALSQLGDRYRGRAEEMLSNLAGRCLLPENEPGILAHTCFHLPANIDVDAPSIFADYFFLAALAFVTGRMKPLFTVK